jgi:tetratricopeptide (TPR) repeat protein
VRDGAVNLNFPIVRVFVSSTWLDLKPERKAIESALQRIRQTKFVGMEYFGSREENTQRASVDEVGRSNVYVGIIAGRYGSGITEDEYHRARLHGLPCFIYFKEEPFIQPGERESDSSKVARLNLFKKSLLDAHIISYFSDPENLAARVAADLHNWLFDEYLTPIFERAVHSDEKRAEIQSALEAIRDFGDLDRKLLSLLLQTGYKINVSADLIVNAGTVNINTAPSTAFGPLHELPAPPRDFTGRADELDQLSKKVKSDGISIFSIRGSGGIGKTALALKFAHLLLSNYPDAQFYIDLHGTDKRSLSSSDVIAHVIRAYRPNDNLPENRSDQLGLYRTVLHNQRVLLLLDNAANRQQVEPLIPAENCLMLLTSRQRFILPGLFARDLDTLGAEDARDLLLRITLRIGEHADRIAELCGYLPLALRVAATTLAENVNLSIEEYIERLTEKRLKVLDEVEASLSLTYELLNPPTQKRMRLLGIFPETFDLEAAASVWRLGRNATLDALGELIRCSLVEWDEASARYRLHDLTRLFMDTHLTEAERLEGQTRHAQHYVDVFQQANTLYAQGSDAAKKGLVIFDLEWTNINQGQVFAESYAEENETLGKLCSKYPLVGSDLLILRRPAVERIKWLEPAIRAARNFNIRAEEGRHLSHIAAAYLIIGKRQLAAEYCEKALAIAREVGDRQAEFNALHYLGWAYKDLDEPHRAIKLHEDGLAIAREIGDGPAEALALNDLGLAYFHFRLRDTPRAITYHEQQLKLSREIGDHNDECLALGNLGNCYLYLEEIDRANEFFGQQLEITRELGNRRIEGICLGNLGRVSLQLDDVDRAIELFRQQLSIAQEIGFRSEEAFALRNIGDACSYRGYSREAISYYEQTLKIHRELKNRLEEAAILGCLGQEYNTLGQSSQAVVFHEQQLNINRELGARRNEAFALNGLGKAFQSLGQPHRAIEFYQQARTIAEDTGNRWSEAYALLSIGWCLLILGEPQRAIEFFEKTLNIRRAQNDRKGEAFALRALGLAHADLGTYPLAIDLQLQALQIIKLLNDKASEGLILNSLANTYSLIGQVEHAAKLQQQCLEISRELGNRKDEGVVLNNLANRYAFLGDIRKAIKHYEEALAIAVELNDKEGEAYARGNLGNRYLDLGFPRKAIELQEQALKLHREIQNRRSEINVLNNLGWSYASLGEPKRAIEFYETALTKASEHNYRQGESRNLTDMGRAYLDLGDTQKALRFQADALSIAKEIHNKEQEAIALNRIGEVYAKQSDFERALEFYQQALSIARDIGGVRHEANALWNISLAIFEIRGSDQAITHAEHALGLFIKLEDPKSEEIKKYLEKWRVEGSRHP